MIFNKYFFSMILLVLVMVTLCSTIMYKSFFISVPPGKMLILISKNGDPLPSGEILAKDGQKGIMEDVYGEGLHFIMPLIYETEIKSLIEIPPGKIGVVVSRVGKSPPSGTILVNDDEKGIRRRVLTPGRYRMNPYGYEVKIYDAVDIKAGFVGFVTSLVGKEPQGVKTEVGTETRFIYAGDGEKGVKREVLQPGLYYLNPYEYRVQEVEIGINQVNFLDAHQIKFPSKDAFDISLEATVEWELLPENVAHVISEFGAKAAIEDNVIAPQSKSIGRIQGSSYGAKDFLLGVEREKFQTTFTRELERICEQKRITIHSAFIRHLSIPDNLLLPIRESFVAVEKEKTAKAWEETKKSAGELERERTTIAQRRSEVDAQTKALVNTVIAETDQEVGNIEAQKRLSVAEKQEEIANIEAQKTILLGEAQATVKRLKGEAVSKGFEAKIKAFGDNPKAFVNYSFAQQIPADIKLNLFYSGQGTFWTDIHGTGGIERLAGMKILQGAQPPAAPTPSQQDRAPAPQAVEEHQDANQSIETSQ